MNSKPSQKPDTSASKSSSEVSGAPSAQLPRPAALDALSPGKKAQIRRLIMAANAVRSTAIGLVSVLLGLYLAEIGFSLAAVGVVVTAGLSGGVIGAAAATLSADRLGRRNFLVAVALLSAAGGLALALLTGPRFALAAGAAFIGMVNGMGRDRGAALVIEQAILPATVAERDRTRAFALYGILEAGGEALGGLLAGLPRLAAHRLAIPLVGATRAALVGYALLMLVTALMYLPLGSAVEVTGAGFGIGHVSPQSRARIRRLSALFALDALGGGFLTHAMLALFFTLRFGLSAGAVGTIFFVEALLNSLSQLLAPPLARRLGLIATMVFTHLPGSLLLIPVAFLSDLRLALALYFIRALLVQMDVPARNSLVIAVVRPEERVFASGMTSLVRFTGWAVAPGIAGLLMGTSSLGAPLLVGSALKVCYDLLLFSDRSLFSERSLRPRLRCRRSAGGISRGPLR